MRLLHLICFAMLLAGPLSAQDLLVRSGEHADFSRLVVTLPQNVEWSMTQTGREAALTTDLPGASFKIDDVFKRIPRTRLARLTQAGAGAPLQMVLACECDVKAYMLPDRRLVVDIKDAQPTESDAIQWSQGADPYRFTLSEAGAGNAEPTPFRLNSRYDGIVRQPAGPEEKKPSPAPSGEKTEKPLPILTELETRFDRNSSEQRLLEQIERAVDQGLLDRTQRPSDARATERAESDEGISQDIAMTPGLSAQTASDRDLAEIRDIIRRTGYDSICLPQQDVALSGWGTDAPFADQISAWRSRLFQEFDAIDRDSQIGLARNYLYFGFGAEAEQVLNLTEEDPRNGNVLRAMSRILDERALDATNPFRGQHSCDGDTALWAVLADLDASPETNDGAVLRALSDLPAHLRVHIAPRISRIYKDAGNAELARTALRIGARAVDTPDPAIGLAEVEIDMLTGDKQKASEQALEIVASGSNEAATALVRLVGLAAETGDAVLPETAELAAAYALEYRGSALGEELQETHVLALALQGQFAEASAELARYEQRVGRAAKPKIRNALLILMTERADDLTFMELTLENTPPHAAQAFEDVAEKMARRLIDMGFSGEARKMLGDLEPTTGGDTRTLLRAEAALAIGLPHRALADLGEKTGNAADRLRAKALLRSGQHDKAAVLFEKVDDPAKSARSFWLAGELADISLDAEPYGPAAQITRQLAATRAAELPSTPLAQARKLLEHSEQDREGISELLSLVRVEDDFVGNDSN